MQSHYTKSSGLRQVTFLLVLILTCISFVRCEPSITSQGQDINTEVGKVVNMPCEVQDLGEQTIEWFFLKDNTQISTGSTILVTQGSHYSIVRPQDLNSGDQHWNLQIDNVRVSDDGHYKCQIQGGVSPNSSIIHTLHVNGVIDTPEVISDKRSFNFSGCCEKKNVSSSCLPACSPYQVDWNTFSPIVACGYDLEKLLACATDGRNHLSCCKRRNIPTVCLDFCYGQSPVALGAEHIQCISSIMNLLQCAEEGQVLLPTPPTSVKVRGTLGEQIIVIWGEPEENAGSVIGYKVVWKEKDSNISDTSELLSEVTTSYNIPNVKENLLYSIYVIAVGQFGSSMPSVIISAAASKNMTADHDKLVKGCCQENQVSSNCSKELCTSSPLDQVNPDVVESCMEELPNIFKCFVGSRNHSSCCAVYGVPETCIPLCAGKLPPMSWDLTQCIVHMPLIVGCIQEGIAFLPGPPTAVEVNEVTDSSALLSWERPSQPVDYFEIKLQLKSTSQISYVQVVGESADLTDLKSNRFYEASMVSVNENGTSLPSVTIRFLTYTREIATPPTPTIPPTTDLTNNVTACCLEKNVLPGCLGFCNYDWTMASMDPQMTVRCADEFPKILSCGTDGRNHTQCCKQRGIIGHCDTLCNYHDGVALEDKHLVCLLQVDIIIPCFKEGLVALPMPPENFTVFNISKHSANLAWQPPSRGPTVIVYLVKYLIPGDTHWHQINTTKQPYILQNLMSNTLLSVKVLSANENGTSLPTPVLYFRTNPSNSLPPSPPLDANGTEIKWNVTWENRKDCCSQQNLSQQCLRQCNTGGFSDPTQCSNDMDKVIACSADGRNHSQCCLQYGVPQPCLSLCEGRPLTRDKVAAMCISHVKTILTCFRIGGELLPSQPLRVQVSRMSDVSVDISWQQPASNCNASDCHFSILYWKKGAKGRSPMPSIVNITTLSQRIEGLEPLSQYFIAVVSVNAHGSSLPSPQLVITTEPEDYLTMSIAQTPDGIVDEGTLVILRCMAFGKPDPKIYWKKNKLILQIERNLVISAATASDTGVYTCVAESDQNTTQKKVDVLLKIKYKPSLLPVTDVSVDPALGLVASLQCAFNGYPDSVEWYKDGAPLDASSQHSQNIYSFPHNVTKVAILQIYNVQTNNYGSYKCNGSNSFGFAVGHLNLNKESPVLPTPPPITVGHNVTNITACCVERNMPPLCLEICRGDVDISVVMADNKYLKCVKHLDIYVECGTDGRDNTPCCTRDGVHPFCLPLCNGVHTGVEALACVDQAPVILDCARSGHADIPSPPYNVHIKLVIRDIVVSWTAPLKNPDKVASYEVHYNTSEDPRDQVITLSPNRTLSMGLEDIHNKLTYYIWMVALNSANDKSQPSNVASITIDGILPSAVTSLSRPKVQGLSMTISWSPPSNGATIDNYTIYYKLFGDDQLKYDKVTKDETTITLNDLMPNSSYQFYVAASNSLGEGAKTEILAFRTIKAMESNKMKGGRDRTAIGLAVGMTFAVLFIVGGIVAALFLLRRHKNKRFRNETVSFENPQYGQRENQVEISGLSHSGSHLKGSDQYGYSSLSEEHDESSALAINKD